jgi:uncharacterized membrane protein
MKVKIIILLAGLAALGVCFGCTKNAEKSQTNPGSANGDLVIQIADITENVLFCPLEIDGTKMEVLAVKAPDGTIRTVFNTCAGCLDSGGHFLQEGTLLVCQICGDRYRMSQLEVEGPAGVCNPVPILPANKTITNSTITISGEFLSQSKNLFARWKQAPAGNTGSGMGGHGGHM